MTQSVSSTMVAKSANILKQLPKSAFSKQSEKERGVSMTED